MDYELQRVLARVLDVSKDPDPFATVLLKGHLIIEEQLNRVLDLSVEAPAHLEAANLRFFQKLKLARALNGRDDPAWTLAEMVNKLRNDLAHNLDSACRVSQIEKISQVLRSLKNIPEVSSWVGTATAEQTVGAAIGVCLGFLASWENELRSER